MNKIPASELILNADKSVYHLGLLPNEISDLIITVGDPDRVKMIARFFDNIELKKQNREFHTITGTYKGKRLTIISTGIGTDNIDIVLNELNILCKVDIESRTLRPDPVKLKIIRIGTSGTMREDIELGSKVITEYALGLEGLMHFYPISYNSDESNLLKNCKEVLEHNFNFLQPYVVSSSSFLLENMSSDMIKGITATCQGFYHPQGRSIWNPQYISILNELRKVEWNDRKLTNFEMETSGILGLSRYFDHEACSISLILANRVQHKFIENGEKYMKEMIEEVLNKIVLLSDFA